MEIKKEVEEEFLRLEQKNGIKVEPPDVLNPEPEPEFSINMKAEEVLAACKGRGLGGVNNCSVLSDKCPPPAPPDPPPQRLTKEQLLPPTPSVFLECKKDAFGPGIQEFCLKHPIAVIRGMAAALKLGEKKSNV